MIDTECSESYTREKFDQVKFGDNEQEIVDLLGQPLFRSYDSVTKLATLSFTNDGRAISFNNPNQELDDFAWYRSSVKIDSFKIVVGIDKGWSYD